jgi:hypothetical protein
VAWHQLLFCTSKYKARKEKVSDNRGVFVSLDEGLGLAVVMQLVMFVSLALFWAQLAQ